MNQISFMSCLPKYEPSDKYLAEDIYIGQSFCKINEIFRKFCPILHISYMQILIIFSITPHQNNVHCAECRVIMKILL